MTDRVGFLVAGVQKGGTTALFDYLREHPGLSLAPDKEVHFFDDETVDWARPDYGAYHARFESGAPGRLKGEATPIYIYWPDCLERIAAYNPGMKLIVLFRDPVARAWSHWRMEHARGAETGPFGWCIREGRARLAHSDRPGFHRVHSYVERGFYGAQLARMRALFPPEQILLIRSVDLDSDPDGVLGRICRFLRVARPGLVRGRRVHVTAPAPSGASLPSVDARHLQALYAEDAAAFKVVSGLDLPPEGGGV